jgi:hypothetical protein
MVDYLPIPDTKLQIALNFVKVDDAPAPVPHYVQGPGGALWLELLLQKVPDSARQNVSTLLNTPLQVLFDDFWTASSAQADVTKRPGTLIKNAIQKEESSAYNITVNLPPKGSLRTVAGNISSGLVSRLPAGEQGHQLTLSYLIPGIVANFKTTTDSNFGSWADPDLNLSFDGEYLVEIVVPDNSSIPMAINTEFLTHNMTGSAGNALTSAELVFKTLIDDMGALLSGNSFPLSPLNKPDQALSAPVPELFAALANGFVSAGQVGFTQLDVIVDTNPPPGNPPGNTVELILTHPFNASPDMRLDPGPWPPQLLVSPQELYPGEALTIKGSFYPPPRATEVSFWTLSPTTAAQTNAVDVQWGIHVLDGLPFNPKTQQFTRDVSSQITVPGLAPSTRYEFRIRTYDVEGFIASGWSNWTSFTTSTTDQVQLSLQDGSTSPVTVVATVPAFSTQLIIPATENPGTYKIESTVPGQASIFSPTFKVIPRGTALSPTLQMLDSNGVPMDNEIEVDFRETYMFLGKNFQVGWVDLYLDTISPATHVTRAWADQTGMFKVGVQFPDADSSRATVGEHFLVAVGGIFQAKAGVGFYGPPR